MGARRDYDIDKLRLCASLGLKLRQISVALGIDRKTACKAIKEQGLRHVWVAKRQNRRY